VNAEQASKRDGLERDGSNLTLRFSAAYIHESEGEPGLDAGISWVQEVRLHFGNAFTSGSMSELPCYLWDDQISLAGESFQMVPVPLEYSGTVELKLVENGQVDGQVEVAGTHVRMGTEQRAKARGEVPRTPKTQRLSPLNYFLRFGRGIRNGWRKIPISLRTPQ